MLGLWSNFPSRQSLKNLNLSGAQLDIFKQNVVTLVAAIYALRCAEMQKPRSVTKTGAILTVKLNSPKVSRGPPNDSTGSLKKSTRPKPFWKCFEAHAKLLFLTLVLVLQSSFNKSSGKYKTKMKDQHNLNWLRRSRARDLTLTLSFRMTLRRKM